MRKITDSSLACETASLPKDWKRFSWCPWQEGGEGSHIHDHSGLVALFCSNDNRAAREQGMD